MSNKLLLGDEVRVLSHDNQIGRVIYAYSEKEGSFNAAIVELPDGTRVELAEGEFVRLYR